MALEILKYSVKYIYVKTVNKNFCERINDLDISSGLLIRLGILEKRVKKTSKKNQIKNLLLDNKNNPPDIVKVNINLYN